ncbi:expressed unknown protein [Seminavis robusta]|uniref:Uncharacterized protein n=1 Tax=Seminavis robusta TaxID=568900 RepID=A0A9N8EBU8_9STRA|nr:expressed unknown protein [Seminavis robusta]|eukprot:Sro918_g220070.1 n/a (1179) ;mRNA; r:36926-40714
MAANMQKWRRRHDVSSKGVTNQWRRASKVAFTRLGVIFVGITLVLFLGVDMADAQRPSMPVVPTAIKLIREKSEPTTKPNLYERMIDQMGIPDGSKSSQRRREGRRNDTLRGRGRKDSMSNKRSSSEHTFDKAANVGNLRRQKPPNSYARRLRTRRKVKSARTSPPNRNSRIKGGSSKKHRSLKNKGILMRKMSGGALLSGFVGGIAGGSVVAGSIAAGIIIAPAFSMTSSPTGPTVPTTSAPTTAPVPTTSAPTVSPSSAPSYSPSVSPSTTPSTTPSITPSWTPSAVGASSAPSTASSAPSSLPSWLPTLAPSTGPSMGPSGGTTQSPSVPPSAGPSENPARVVTTRTLSSFAIQNLADRFPTQEEIDGVMVQLSLFFSALLTDRYPGASPQFESFTPTVDITSSEVRGPFIITDITYDSETVFVDSTNLPTSADIDSIFQNADYQVFLTDYIPNVTPTDSIFLQTVSVSSNSGIDARVASRARSGLVLSEASRLPNDEEISGIAEQLRLFFSDVVDTAYPSFETLELVVVDSASEFDGGMTLSDIEYTLDSTFVFGDTPTVDEFDALLEGADYNRFITDFVPNTTPADSVYRTTIAVATDSGITAAPTSAPTLSTTVTSQGVLAFTLGDTSGEFPNSDEVAGIMDQIDLFFAEVLSAAYDNFESVTTNESGSSSSTDSQDTFTDVPYTLVATFTDGTDLPLLEDLNTLLENADYGDFIRNFVPNAQPEGTIFLKTEQVTNVLDVAVDTSAVMRFIMENTFGRTPTDTEVDGIMVQVNLFYTDVLRAAFPNNFLSFQASSNAYESFSVGTFTFTDIDYAATTLFINSNVPSRSDVEDAIQAADLNDFIQNFIPNTEPTGSVFLLTQMVTSTQGSPAPSSAPSGQTPAPSSMAPTQPDIVESVATLTFILDFGFNGGQRVPTQEEIDGILVQVGLFYTDVLRAEFPNFETFQVVEEVGTVSELRGPFITVTRIAYAGETMFTPGTMTPTKDDVEVVIAGADLEGDFLVNYVPNATPDGTVFTRTSAVVSDTGTSAPTSIVGFIGTRAPTKIPAETGARTNIPASAPSESPSANSLLPSSEPSANPSEDPTVSGTLQQDGVDTFVFTSEDEEVATWRTFTTTSDHRPRDSTTTNAASTAETYVRPNIFRHSQARGSTGTARASARASRTQQHRNRGDA